ncbi:hypothetical protein EBU99_11725 [bacterium]|nr:hypothetical protein [bacterium]
MRLQSLFPLAVVLLISACIKKNTSTPLEIIPDSGVMVPLGAAESLGLSEDLVKRVYAKENLLQAQSQLVAGKSFELNILMKDDWQGRLPLRLRSGATKKYEDLQEKDDVVGLGDLQIKGLKTFAQPADSLRRMSTPSALKPFDLMKIELASASLLDLIAALNAVHKLPSVLFAEPNFKVQKIGNPNDPSFPSLWGMTKIRAPETWSSFTGDQDFTVAVIDTGVDMAHEDLKDNIWTNKKEIPGNGIDDDGNGYIDDIHGWDFAYGDNDPTDGDSHGTHCAGTIAARGNNAIGVAGVNWSARIMPVKVLDDTGSGYNYDIYNGIIYAISNGAKVTSNSYGGGGASSLMASAIKAAQDAGSLFVVAAGNESANKASYPAYYTKNYSNMLSVASSETNDSLSSFSNYGDGVDVAAPGRSILSTIPGNKYATYSGTSMATPHVAGVAALLWAAAPSKSLAEVRSAIISKSSPVSALSGKVASGGVVDLKSAFDSLGVVATPSPTATATASPTASVSPTSTATASPTATATPTATVTASPSPTASPTPTPVPTPTYGDGIRYRSYHGFWLRLPNFDALLPVSQGVLSDIALTPARRSNQFGFVFEGQIWVPTNGAYTFYLKSDDGSSLSIDSQKLINNDGLHGPLEKQAVVSLARGFHSIRVDYFQLLGSAQLNVQWMGPGLTKRKLGGKGVLYFH